jgi:hypothetical protein
MTGTEPVLHVVETASDPSRHVLAGEILSPASNEEVRETILRFLEAKGVAR